MPRPIRKYGGRFPNFPIAIYESGATFLRNEMNFPLFDFPQDTRETKVLITKIIPHPPKSVFIAIVKKFSESLRLECRF